MRPWEVACDVWGSGFESCCGFDDGGVRLVCRLYRLATHDQADLSPRLCRCRCAGGHDPARIRSRHPSAAQALATVHYLRVRPCRCDRWLVLPVLPGAPLTL